MTQFPDLFAALSAPFDPQEVRARTQGGRQVQYITARTAMNRLDSVLGPENWWDEYVPGESSVLCRLTVRLPDGTALTKADAGGYAGMPDQGDDDKSGFSDSFKRAAVKFGVGRYLYRDGVPDFGGDPRDQPPPGAPARRPNPGPKPRPAPWGTASPAPTKADPGPKRFHGRREDRVDLKARGRDGRPLPRTGRDLYRWAKDTPTNLDLSALNYLNKWGKMSDYPARVVDWTEDQVKDGLRRVLDYIDQVESQESGPDDPADAYGEVG